MTFLLRRSYYLLPLLLVACEAPDPSRVPVTMMGTNSISNVQEMTARAGETPEAFAKSSGMDISQLLEMNGLVSQQKLTPGQRLKVPTPSEIKVIEGDSIDSIAKSLGLDRNAIIQQNDLKPPYAVARGQVLKLPQANTAVASVANPAVSSGNLDSLDSRTPAPMPTDDALPAATPSSPITTTDGAGGEKIHSSASGTITEQDLAPPPGATAATTPPPKAVTPATDQTQIASLTPPAKPAPAAATLGTDTPKFSWPVNGSTLSGYGPSAGGTRNDGLDIGAPLGTPVRAAAPGEVVYTGDNVAGFGNLVLIRHSGGFATAYGHIQKPLVKRGDHVTAGQSIAQIGKTGNVATPQLHFEIRKGTLAVDPKPYLP